MIFMGFNRTNEAFQAENAARSRSNGATSPEPQKLVRLLTEFPDKAPEGCRVVGAWVPISGAAPREPGPPGVMVVETDNFQWVPALALGSSRKDREMLFADAARVQAAVNAARA